MNENRFLVRCLLWAAFCFWAGFQTGFLRAQDATELAEFQFQAAPPRSGSGMRLEQTAPNALKMAMTSAADYGSEWIYAKFRHDSMAQQKFTFRVKGSAKNGTAFFHPILIIRDGNREREVVGPRIAANGNDFHLYVLGLDSDFQLGDGPCQVTGLQFSFNSAREPLKKELAVELDHIRFVNPEAVTSRKKLPMIVRRSPADASASVTSEPAAKTDFRMISIFFDYDNNDFNASVSKKGRYPLQSDDCAGDFSFRKLMLENCPIFRIAAAPEEADLLVYQRTTPSDQAETLAKLARSGKPLVLYGEIPDPELAELAPLRLTRLPQDRFAPREKLVSDSSFSRLARRIQDCAFGRYFEAEPVSDASVLLKFDGSGVPYLARKGNVLHLAGTVGQTLIPSPVFYDKFSLLLWARLAGTPQTAEAIEAAEQTELKRRAPQTFTRDGLTWHQTTNGFGRFGWLVGDPGLVDAVSADLTVTNGEQLYRFDSCTETAANGDSQPQLSLTANCSDVRKHFRLAFPPTSNAAKPEVLSLTLSLLTPFSVWEFERMEKVFLTQENVADFAAWQTADGVKIVPLKELTASSLLFDVKRDGRWGAPWLLLYRENEARPLLLVFPSQPQAITARVSYGILEGFEIAWGDRPKTTPKTAPNVLIAGWPWGALKRDLSGWGRRLPAEALEKIDWGVSQALCFPSERTEFFALDPQNDRVRLRMNVSFTRFEDDWQTKAKPFVSLPPLTAFMLQEGRAGRLEAEMVQTSETLRDFDVPTPFGPSLGKAGRSIEWSLPLPDSRDLLFVRMKEEETNALQNQLFLDGVKWTCGGHVPLESLSPAHPSGSDSEEPNISHFTWNFGIGTALQGKLLLNSEALTLLERRTAIRTIEPMELYQPKAFARHRSEPFSGLCYPVVFNSFYLNDTPYEPGFGSHVIYGDTNEAACVVAWLNQELADLWGMRDLVRANWNFFRYVMRHQWFLDDYCFQAGSCREYGAGAWIDMLNAEYSGMIAYARLAQIAGDEREYAEAICRAAKKAVPTIARIYFNPWLEQLRPELKGQKYLVTGFGEEGAKVMTFPTDSGNFRAANDLFDFSQGIPGSQYQLYRKYAWNAIQRYLTQIAWPELKAQTLPADEQNPPKTLPSYDYLAALGLYFDDLKIVNDYARAVCSCPENRKAEDWPGIRHPFQIACVQWRNHHRLAITRFQDLKIDLAEWDPQARTLVMKLTAGPEAILEIHSELPPVSAVRNGKSLKLAPSGSGEPYYLVPLAPDVNELEIQF